MCYEISEFIQTEEGYKFFISCQVMEDDSSRFTISAEYAIDDDLNEDSYCTITARNGVNEEVLSAEIRFHNGDGYEGEEGLMEVSNDSEFDVSELEDFHDELFEAIEDLNPYPAQLKALVYESKGADSYVADFPCEQCGKIGISINANFLPIGKCCYCGYINELAKCERCEEMVSVSEIKNGFCLSCAEYIKKQ